MDIYYRYRLRKTARAFWLTFKDRKDVWFACISLYFDERFPPISIYLTNLKKYLERKKIKAFGYIWVVEHKGKSPHYHLCLALKKGQRIPKPDLHLWKWGPSHLEYKPFIGFKYLAKAWKYRPKIPYTRKYGVGWLKNLKPFFKFNKTKAVYLFLRQQGYKVVLLASGFFKVKSPGANKWTCLA